MGKLLVWTRGGFTILHKCLEKGRFTFPKNITSDAKSAELEVHELCMLLEGIDARVVRAQKRWEPPLHTRGATSP